MLLMHVVIIFEDGEWLCPLLSSAADGGSAATLQCHAAALSRVWAEAEGESRVVTMPSPLTSPARPWLRGGARPC